MFFEHVRAHGSTDVDTDVASCGFFAGADSDLSPHLDRVTPTRGPDNALGVGDAGMVDDRVEAEQARPVVAGLFKWFGIVKKLPDGLSDNVDIFQLETIQIESVISVVIFSFFLAYLYHKSPNNNYMAN